MDNQYIISEKELCKLQVLLNKNFNSKYAILIDVDGKIEIVKKQGDWTSKDQNN